MNCWIKFLTQIIKNIKSNDKVCLLFIIVSLLNACGVKQLSSRVTNSGKTTIEIPTVAPKSIPPLLINKLSAGDDFTCATEKASDNTITAKAYCWGINNSLQLGTSAVSTNQKTPLVIPELATKNPLISLGSAFGCMLGGTNSMKSWGRNDQFQTGNAQQTTGTGGVSFSNVVDPNSDTAHLPHF